MVFSDTLVSVDGVTLVFSLFALFGVIVARQIRLKKVKLDYKLLILLNTLILISDAFSGAHSIFMAKALTLCYLNLPFIFYIIFDNLLSQNVNRNMSNLWVFTQVMLWLAVLSIAYGYIFGFNYADVSNILSVLRYVSIGFENQVVFILMLVVSHTIASFMYLRSRHFSNLILLVCFTAFVFMTFSRFAIVMILINIYLLLTLIFTRRKFVFIRFSFVSSVIVLLAGFGFLDRFLDLGLYFSEKAQTDVARTVFFVRSFDLAVINFPYGSGLGTFGSVAAKVFYSPVYYEFGFHNIHGLEPDAHLLGRDYRVDTLIPHYLGELGFIVTIVYLSSFFFLFYRVFKVSKNKKMKDIQYFVASLAIFSAGSMLSSPWVINPVGICITMWLLVSFKNLTLGAN